MHIRSQSLGDARFRPAVAVELLGVYQGSGLQLQHFRPSACLRCEWTFVRTHAGSQAGAGRVRAAVRVLVLANVDPASAKAVRYAGTRLEVARGGMNAGG